MSPAAAIADRTTRRAAQRRAPGRVPSWARATALVLPPRRGAFRDAALYAAGAAIAAIAALATENAIHRSAAVAALPVYLVAVPVALALVVASGRWSERRVFVLRVVLAGAVLVGAGLVPQSTLIASRSEDPTGHHSHAETAVIEEGARTLVAGGDPYDTTFDQPGIAYWSEPVRDHFPYLPAMLVLGLPRVLLDDAPFADARVVFVAVTLIALVVALARWRAPGDRKLLVFQWLLVLPTGTLIMIGGGHDLPVLALLFLSLVLLERRNLLGAAVVLGLAAAMRHNAWVLLPFLVLASGSWRDRWRVGLATVVTAIAVTGPFAAWNTDAFVEDVVRWPLNLGEAATNAQAPTLGGWVVDLFPTGRAVVVALLLGAVLVAAVALTLLRPPRTAADAALYAGLTLLGLMVAAPSGRVGYLIYPIGLVVWALALRRSGAEDDESPAAGPRGSSSSWYAPRDSNPEPID